jgi:hypothetical protein
MATIQVELGESDSRELGEVAAGRGLSPAQLAQRWIEERLLHERERAAGGGRPAQPRGEA